ncbi:hypothetical protein Gohar_020583 [Gossypium harknessii]|uniref:RNase H type-1 domain-containing protein n=1 Tax=Gossypium harknessii TaxID=34285 RepID=A0A7J9HY31_9ROSI|nr:hypothetical protein [Gossypium harknessii]
MKGCWQFPNHGWIKVNVEGSVPTFKPRATIGGVVRGPSGCWMAEKGYRNVEIESDNSLLIAIIQNELATNNNYNEVRLIQDWCLMDCEVKFRQILRESNRVADRIAKEARDEMDQLIIHKEPLGA